ncbi:MAG: carboxypeptidase-like regulatory domain-containing protein, partial [Kangiellaceae bacterium]|nr:carboxypeptidase-like regulatory domain-containing protein [Kangiellaceae bacterium]
MSKAIRDLQPLQEITPQRKIKLKASGEKVPGEDLVKEVPNRFPFSTKLRQMQAGEKYNDPVLQKEIKRSLYQSKAPEIGANFDGMTNPQGYVPPDTNGSVGPNHYVQTVNVSLAIWDKLGNQLVAPVAINSLWAGFGGICETNNNGDPIVLYDRRADRWMISQFALASGDNHQCIAISQTGDPTGAYYLYDFPYGALMNDYPHFGIFGDAYYMGVNQFGSGFAGGGMAAYERDKMLVGAEAKQVIISGEGMSPTVFTPMPLDVDGITQPPADMNQYFVWANGDGQSKLHVWEMDVDWNDINAATFTEVADLDVSTFAGPSNATQPNGQELDALGIRSMFRTAYRNINGQGKILFTHNIAGPSGQPVARWYELDVDHSNGHAVTLNQEGTFSPDSSLAPSTAARWMVSGAMDANGNIAIGYTVSSDSIHPSIHAATRLSTDPAGQMTDEFVLVEVTGSQAAVNRGRWADYASMSIDPVDDCTFWYTNEYYKAENDNTLTWSTRISSFKIPSCTMGPTGMISGVVTDETSGDPIASATVSAGNISTVTNSNGEYSFVLPVGDYDLEVFRYGWVMAQQADVTVAEDDELTNNFALAAAAQVELTGTVTDSGNSNPLYAKVTASVPGDSIVAYTNPETGEYVLPVFEGTTINISTMAQIDGYQLNSQDVLPMADTSAPMALSFTLDEDGTCTAPGLQWVEPSFVQRFEGGVFPPTGWTVTEDAGDGVAWGSALAGRGNITGTEGDAALADSDAAGPGNDADTSLVSPVINVADISSTTLNFVANYRPL